MAAMVGAQPPWSMLLWTFFHSFTGCHRYLGGEGGDRSASSRDSLKNGKASSPAIPGSRIEYCPEAPPLPSQRTGHFPPWPSLRLSRHRGKHPEAPRAAPQKAGSEITALHLKEGWKGLWGEKVLDLFWRSLEKTSWEGNCAAKSHPRSGRNSRPLPEVPGGWGDRAKNSQAEPPGTGGHHHMPVWQRGMTGHLHRNTSVLKHTEEGAVKAPFCSVTRGLVSAHNLYNVCS